MPEEFNREASALRADEFDGFYKTPPPWDIGRAQPVFVALAEAGELRGRVLDVGCGTGEHALLAAERGHAAVGVDVAPTAIAQARSKAAERGLDVTFIVGNVLDLPDHLDGTFDTVIDSAVFHVFNDEDRGRYVRSLAAVLEPGGRYFMIGFSDQVPGTVGPRRLSEAEIRAAFADGWDIESIADATLVTAEVDVPALFVRASRL